MPRAKKGTVSIASQDGMLRLRWRHLGKVHTLPLGLADTPLHRRIAQGKASEIQADIAFDRFDDTLAKYKHDRPFCVRSAYEDFGVFIFLERYHLKTFSGGRSGLCTSKIHQRTSTYFLMYKSEPLHRAGFKIENTSKPTIHQFPFLLNRKEKRKEKYPKTPHIESNKIL